MRGIILKNIIMIVLFILTIITTLFFYGCTIEDISKPNQTIIQNYAAVTIIDTSAGRILADNEGYALYVYDSDTIGTSECYGACEDTWQPLVIPPSTVPIGGELTGNLGAMQRNDGRWQVTFNGRPLYTYINDDAPGVVNGQGVDGDWQVVFIDASNVSSISTGETIA